MPPAAQATVITLNAGDDLQTVINGAASGDTIKLTGNFSVTTGLGINAKNITFDLNGFNLNISNNASDGLSVYGGSVVDYTGTGSFTASSYVSVGIRVWDNGSSCTLTGVQTTANMVAIFSINQTTVIVNGNVTATGAGSWGIVAQNGSTVTVNGNVTATNTGVQAAGANTTVTVNGTITAPTYIVLNGFAKTAADFVTPPPTPGYNTYRDATPTTVWVLLAPVIATPAGALADATAGTAYSATLAASGSPTSWALTGAPAWLSISNAGVLSGTPPAAAAGTTVSFSVTASNGGGASAPVAFNIAIRAPGTGTATAVPTLGEWSLVLLALAMLGVAGAGLKRRG